MKKLFLFICFFPAALLYGQDSIQKPSENYFRYMYENDFFSATDRYYTQGIRFDIIHRSLSKNPLSKMLLRLRTKTKDYNGIGFQREGFTPGSIRYDTLNDKERPYASVSYISIFRISLNRLRKEKLISAFSFGMIGPSMRGMQEQKFIHEVLDNIQPLGWENQIKDDIILNYDFTAEKGIVTRNFVEFIAQGELRAGTLYSNLAAGLTTRIGKMNPYFGDLGLSSGSKQKFQLFLIMSGEVRLVGYNATLQGGIFNKSSIHTLSASQIARVVFQGTGGLSLSYKRVSLEYSRTIISKEFQNGLGHGWGSCSIRIRM